MDIYRARYTSDHSTASAVATHSAPALAFDETPLPPSTIHEDVSPPVPSFDKTSLVTAPVPETPTIPSVAKRWRSGTLHVENLVSMRWRSDTLHPETPVPTTTPPQLRWRAGVLRNSKTPRHTIRSLGTCETISIGSGSSDDDNCGVTL